MWLTTTKMLKIIHLNKEENALTWYKEIKLRQPVILMATLGGKYIMVKPPGNDLASKKEIIWYTVLSHHSFSDKTSNCPMVQTALWISDSLHEGKKGEESHIGYFLLICSRFVKIKYIWRNHTHKPQVKKLSDKYAFQL